MNSKPSSSCNISIQYLSWINAELRKEAEKQNPPARPRLVLQKASSLLISLVLAAALNCFI